MPGTEGTVGILYLYQPVANDPDGDMLEFSLQISPAGMTIDPATGRIDWTPEAGQIGINGVILKVADGNGGSASQAYDINVSPVAGNSPPAFVSVPPMFATENVAYTYPAVAMDAEDEPVVYELVAGPADMTMDPAT
ncbi:MAG: Ig domain-containing protein, partial [Phycisphaerae bacterium]